MTCSLTILVIPEKGSWFFVLGRVTRFTILHVIDRYSDRGRYRDTNILIDCSFLNAYYLKVGSEILSRKVYYRG